MRTSVCVPVKEYLNDLVRLKYFEKDVSEEGVRYRSIL